MIKALLITVLFANIGYANDLATCTSAVIEDGEIMKKLEAKKGQNNELEKKAAVESARKVIRLCRGLDERGIEGMIASKELLISRFSK